MTRKIGEVLLVGTALVVLVLAFAASGMRETSSAWAQGRDGGPQGRGRGAQGPPPSRRLPAWPVTSTRWKQAPAWPTSSPSW